jgi:hypothetical protein
MRPLYAKVKLVVVRATESDEETDLLSKRCEWVVRNGRLEDGENTLNTFIILGSVRTQKKHVSLFLCCAIV